MPLPHRIGTFGESVAEQFLVGRGYTLVERNAHVDGDELDLIMADASMIVAVEVKTTSKGADPFEAIDDDKMLRLRRATEAYRLQISRIDAIGVTLDGYGATIHWVQAMQ